MEINDNYRPTDKKVWAGRSDLSLDNKPLYWHQALRCINIIDRPIPDLKKGQKGIALVGYACDEGVRRNQGRVGAVGGPQAIRNMMSTMSYHLDEEVIILDIGDIFCRGTDLEKAQERISQVVKALLQKSYFPVLLGGGHDLAYAHYSGIRQYLGNSARSSSVGIINLDAHFDLRPLSGKGTSGTPFSQIADRCNVDGEIFNYLCLGIQKAANNRLLFEKADELKAGYLFNNEFSIENWELIEQKCRSFIGKVEYIYLTIDMDGFASAYAPGVSAPSPFGFNPEVVERVLKLILDSGKMISMDIVELNPSYDIDGNTARLAGRLAELICCNIALRH